MEQTARRVLITGASSGIGAATAAHLLSRGFEVFGTSRRPPSPANTPAADDREIRWIEMDVTDDASVAQGVAKIGRLDAVVCNAGFGIFGSVEEVPIDAARAQFETNFFGTLRTLRSVVPEMRAARAGRIAIVSSLAARAAIPFQAHYSASKGALDSLAMALYSELRPFGVHVSLIEPGDIDTGFNDATDFGDHADSPYGEAIRRAEQVIRERLPQSPKPQIVARAIERALTVRRPKLRYPVGPDSLAAPFGRRFLPDKWFLRLVGARYGS